MPLGFDQMSAAPLGPQGTELIIGKEFADLPMLCFSGWRREMPILWSFVAFGVVEVALTHLVVSHFSPLAAWLLTGIGLLAILLLLLVRHQLRTRSVAITADALLVPMGLRGSASIPLECVSHLSHAVDPKHGGGTLECISLLGCNCQLLVKPPVLIASRGGTRAIDRILMSLDDSARFCAELAHRQGARLAE